MRRTLITAMTVVAALSSVQGARAVFFDDGVHYVKQGFHENQRWPWPYPCPDRIAVREPFCIMVNNGWRRQNLLGDYYFNPNTNQLTTAGQLRVQWIMTQAPPERRAIFLEHELNPEVNSARLAVVRDYATKVSMDGQPPQITETYLMAEGRSAAIVDATNVKFFQNQPPPVLPAVQASNATTGN